MRRFGGTLVRHRWLVVALWIALVAGAQALAAGVGSDLRDEFTVAGTDSQEAADLLEEAFPDTSGDADLFVWRVNEGNALDRGTRSLVQPLLDELEALPSVTAVTSPFGGDRATAEQVSADRRTAYARIQFDGSAEEVPHEEIEDFVDVVEQLDAVPTVSAGASGVVVGQLATPEVGILELIGVLFAAIVLYMAFGSLLAATLPIMVAAAALGVGVAMVMLLSNAMSVPTASVTIGVLLGLGVGIDYALFLVSRYRTALRAGRSVQEAVVESVDSSGRAVVFAGSTVVVSLLGLVLIGLSFLTGIGIAVAVTVLFTIVAAVTLLPAVLAIVGTRVLSRSARRGIAAPAHDAAGGGGEPQAWWVRLLARRPMAAVAVGAAAMLALSVPVEDLRLGTADQGSDPSGSVSRVGYDLLADGFGPGVNGPLLVTAATPDEPARRAADRLSEELRGLDGVASVSPAQASPDRAAALIQVVPTTVPQDEATESLIERIREDVAAPAEAQTPSLSVHVGGSTAMFDDFATTVTDALPMFFAAIIGLSFLLLVLTFRSLLVPALGAVMNALGAAAAFGVMVAIFQWGWGAELLNVDKEGPIEPFIPVIAFAILFGLSMDYQVFLVSRVHEEWVATRDNRRAVLVGLQQTRPVITAAALIMVFVFSAFVTGDSRIIKLVGTGLAIGVALDAFVLRQTLVPGALLLGGRANWWLPSWLDRLLPHVSVEGPAGGSGHAPAAPREPALAGSHAATSTTARAATGHRRRVGSHVLHVRPRLRTRPVTGSPLTYAAALIVATLLAARALCQRHSSGSDTGRRVGHGRRTSP